MACVFVRLLAICTVTAKAAAAPSPMVVPTEPIVCVTMAGAEAREPTDSTPSFVAIPCPRNARSKAETLGSKLLRYVSVIACSKAA